MQTINTFIYKDQRYVRVVPSKRLFNSTMVHEVVNRGDFFAVHIASGQLTIIPGNPELHHTPREYKLIETEESKEAATERANTAELARENLKSMLIQMVMELEK